MWRRVVWLWMGPLVGRQVSNVFICVDDAKFVTLNDFLKSLSTAWLEVSDYVSVSVATFKISLFLIPSSLGNREASCCRIFVWVSDSFTLGHTLRCPYINSKAAMNTAVGSTALARKTRNWQSARLLSASDFASREGLWVDANDQQTSKGQYSGRPNKISEEVNWQLHH